MANDEYTLFLQKEMPTEDGSQEEDDFLSEEDGGEYDGFPPPLYPAIEYPLDSRAADGAIEQDEADNYVAYMVRAGSGDAPNDQDPVWLFLRSPEGPGIDEFGYLFFGSIDKKITKIELKFDSAWADYTDESFWTNVTPEIISWNDTENYWEISDEVAGYSLLMVDNSGEKWVNGFQPEAVKITWEGFSGPSFYMIFRVYTYASEHPPSGGEILYNNNTYMSEEEATIIYL